MRIRAVVVRIVALTLGGLCHGADAPENGEVELLDGRVLHHVRVLEDEGASIVIRADEGLIKVAKDDLPASAHLRLAPKAAQGSADSSLVMKPFDPDLVPAEAPAAPEPNKPAPRPASPPPQGVHPAVSAVYKGCSIKSFQVKPYQGALGCLEVIVSNPTDQVVVLHPGDFVCITSSGSRHIGRNLITEGYPPRLKRREVVPQQGEIDDIVTFTEERLDNPTVEWAH